MNVALVLQKLAGLGGGAERVVVELARELARRGHRPTIVTFELAAGPPHFDPASVPVVNLMPHPLRRLAVRRRGSERTASAGTAERRVSTSGNRWPLTHLKWHLTHGLFARRMARWLRDHPQDAVIGFLPPAISAVAIAGRSSRVGRPRLIASTHSAPAEDFGDTDRWDRNPVARRRNLDALVAVDAVTVLQEEFIDQLPLGARDHAVVIPNPVRRVAPPSDAARERLVIGVGRLTEQKRYRLLIEAFDRIADTSPSWQLEIHGDGPERDTLQALVRALGRQDRVRLCGATDRIGPVYDRAQILVHPASFEGFGLAVAEAITHGVMVVGFAECSGVNRLVEPGRSGVLVGGGPDPAGALADGLRRLIDHPLPPAERQAAAAALGARFDPAGVVDAWERTLLPLESVRP